MSFDGWKEYRLEEFCEQKKEGYVPNSNDDLKYIGLEHINQQTLAINGVGSSKDVTSNKFRFCEGDILFGKLRPYFRKVYRPKFSGVCSTDIMVLKSKFEVDQGFLFYFLASQEFIDLSNAGSSGTRMPRADWNHLKDTRWLLPPLPHQKFIANLLTSLDDKIDLNRQNNQTLEAIAQAPFKEWFVDINFPGAIGEMQDSELGEIPKGWKVGKLGEFLTVKGGTTPSTKLSEYWNGEFHWATPKDLSNLISPVLLSTERKLTEKGVKQISSGILSEGTLLLSSRAPIGYLAITDIPVSINQGFIAINGTELSNIYLLFWLKQNIEKIISRANGSTFLEISKSAFKEIEAIIPSKGIVNVFDKVALPLFEQMKNNEQQTETLIRLRDTLLPKLMKGEIDVLQAETQTAAVI